MQGIIPVLFFVLITAGMLAWGITTHKRMMEQFRAWAAALGLEVKSGKGWTASPEAEGMRGGRILRVNTFTTGSGKSRQVWLAAGMATGVRGGLELEFKRQGFATTVAEWFGAKEVKVGEPGFDGRWFVRTNRPEFVRAALLPEMRTRIDEAGTLGGRAIKIEVKDGWARYVEQGGVNPKACARVERLLPLLEELAVLADVAAQE